MPAEVGDFWRWAYSDLLMNKTRGVLAEFIVAKALGLDLSVRNAWSHHDLVTKKGTSIEVKASGYLQSWEQKELSKPSWSGLKSRNYDDAAPGEWGLRQAGNTKRISAGFLSAHSPKPRNSQSNGDVTMAFLDHA